MKNQNLNDQFDVICAGYVGYSFLASVKNHPIDNAHAYFSKKKLDDRF